MKLPEDNGKKGCGVWMLKTDESDPFHVACVVHDKQYELKAKGLSKESRKDVDDAFINWIFTIAKLEEDKLKRMKLYARATLYAGLVKVFGRFFW